MRLVPSLLVALAGCGGIASADPISPAQALASGQWRATVVVDQRDDACPSTPPDTAISCALDPTRHFVHALDVGLIPTVAGAAVTGTFTIGHGDITPVHIVWTVPERGAVSGTLAGAHLVATVPSTLGVLKIDATVGTTLEGTITLADGTSRPYSARLAFPR